MKLSIFTSVAALLVTGSNAFATLYPVRCDVNDKQTVRSVNVYDGDEVTVIVDHVNPSTGYTEVSAEGLVGKFVMSTSIIPGAGGKMTFRIKPDQQDQATATYTFEYKRPWEKKAAASTCLVTIVKK